MFLSDPVFSSFFEISTNSQIWILLAELVCFPFFFKPFGNHIVNFMTIYVSQLTSLTPTKVDHFSDLSTQSLGLFGIQKMCDIFLFFAYTGMKLQQGL